HTIGLTGLTAGTQYHYRVTSVNVGGSTTSADFTFSTNAIPTVFNVSASGITGSSATITWSTSQPTTSQVEYGVTASYGSTTTLDGSFVTSHSQGLTGLTAGTTYHYRVISTNAQEVTAMSGDLTFTTTAAPVITAGPTASALTATGATVGWTTDQTATTQVEYGLTTDYGTTTTLNPSLVTAHSQGLTGLTFGTTYHYRVISTNSVGLTTTSADASFTTVGLPIVSNVHYVVANGVMAWTTDQAADSRVDYGLTTNYGNTSTLASLVTNHNVVLTALAPGT